MKLEQRNYDVPRAHGKRPTSPLALLACLGLVAFSGCGYTLKHRLKDTFRDERGIFVPVFDNRTEETGAERVFTNALIRELQSRGEIVLGSRAGGSLELRGAIASLAVGPTASFTDPGFRDLKDYRRLPTEYGINVTISLQLIDHRKKQPVWSGSFSGYRRVQVPIDRTRDYEATSSLGLITQSIIESRYQDVARDIMRDVYDDMVELF